jgi:hypothetical protein
MTGIQTNELRLTLNPDIEENTTFAALSYGAANPCYENFKKTGQAKKTESSNC